MLYSYIVKKRIRQSKGVQLLAIDLILGLAFLFARRIVSATCYQAARGLDSRLLWHRLNGRRAVRPGLAVLFCGADVYPNVRLWH